MMMMMRSKVNKTLYSTSLPANGLTKRERKIDFGELLFTAED